MKKADQILKRAQMAARSAPTWADLSNILFNPSDGLIAPAYPSRPEREEFVKTEQYRQIRELLSQAIEASGLVEGATPKKKSGKFVVRVPQSLHAALEREAMREGVSLNQLVVAKLAVQLNVLTA